MPAGHGPPDRTNAPFYCACAAALAVHLCAGCNSDIAASNRRDPADQFPPDKVLSSSDEEQILAAFNDFAAGQEAKPLVAAADGYRWSDVPGALRAAAGPCFLGVASVSSTDEEVKALLVMTDGQHGEAIVTRTPTGVAIRASFGVLGDAKLEARFEGLFHLALKQMGAAKRPQ